MKIFPKKFVSNFKCQAAFIVVVSVIPAFVFSALAQTSDGSTEQWHEAALGLTKGDTVVFESIPGSLKLYEVEGESIVVKYRGIEKEELSLSRTGKALKLVGSLASGGNTIVQNDGTSSVTVRTSGSNNRVVVNGKEIVSPSESSEEIRVEVGLPKGVEVRFSKHVRGEATVAFSKIEADLEGISRLNIASADSATINLGGTSQLVLGAVSGPIEAKLSGVGRLTLKDASDSAVSVNMSGSSKFKAAGSFKSLDIETNASSRSQTNGTVSGDVNLTANGASRINHVGEVRGEVHQKRNGAARVTVKS